MGEEEEIEPMSTGVGELAICDQWGGIFWDEIKTDPQLFFRVARRTMDGRTSTTHY